MKDIAWLRSVWLLLILVFFGCGLDGIDGQLLRIEGENYVVMGDDGKELTMRVDQRTHKDEVVPGDKIHAYVTKNGHAEFIQHVTK